MDGIDVVLANLEYIERELPELRIAEEVRQRLLATCQALEDGAAELRKLGKGAEARDLVQRQVEMLDETVMAVRELPPEGDNAALEVLFNESGANMLRAYIGLSKSLE